MKKIEIAKPYIGSAGSGCGDGQNINYGLQFIAQAIVYLADVIKEKYNLEIEKEASSPPEKPKE